MNIQTQRKVQQQLYDHGNIYYDNTKEVDDVGSREEYDPDCSAPPLRHADVTDFGKHVRMAGRLPRPAAHHPSSDREATDSTRDHDLETRSSDYLSCAKSSYTVKAYIFRPHRSRRAFLFAISSIGVPYQPSCGYIRYAIRSIAVLSEEEHVYSTVGYNGRESYFTVISSSSKVPHVHVLLNL
jgi:hypothetical protein